MTNHIQPTFRKLATPPVVMWPIPASSSPDATFTMVDDLQEVQPDATHNMVVSHLVSYVGG